MEILHPDEIEVVRKGREYRMLKEAPGYKRLIQYLIAKCNEKEEKLRTGEELEDRASLRLLDRWRSFEEFYAEMITEIESSIRAAEDKERELTEQGIEAPELLT